MTANLKEGVGKSPVRRTEIILGYKCNAECTEFSRGHSTAKAGRNESIGVLSIIEEGEMADEGRKPWKQGLSAKNKYGHEKLNSL